MSYVHFRILFDNLISNSFKYKKNFLKLEIKIFFSADEHKVHVKYVDNGIGIPEHDLRNIFNFFKRGSNLGQLQGAGIGLTQIKKLILKYNEKIDLYSKEDEGVTFIFTLPKLKK